MGRRLSLVFLLAATICAGPVAGFTQQPAVDAALAAQFVAADAGAREALIRTHAEILETTFTAWLNTEGQRLRGTGDYDGAERYHNAALYVGEQHDRPATVVAATNALSDVAAARNDVPKAMQLAERALAIAERANSITGQQQSWYNIGWLQRRTGELDHAEVSLQKALDLAQQLNDPLLIGRAYQAPAVCRWSSATAQRRWTSICRR